MNTRSITLDLVTQGDLWPLRVLGTHQQALTLATPTNSLFAFVTPYHGNGPFHIVIAPTQLAALQQQPVLYLHDESIKAGPITLPLASFTRWDPHLPPLLAFPSASCNLLYQRYYQLGRPGLGLVILDLNSQPATRAIPTLRPCYTGHTTQRYYHRTQQAIEHLLHGLCEPNVQDIADGAQLLAGLGPGLTPAGDDFLVGLLTAFYALGPHCAPAHWPAWQAYTHIIAHTARPYTTQLSATWLTHAGDGAFGEAWHNLIHAINANQPQAIIACTDRILKTGATSGADALSGFLWGMAVLEGRMKDEG